MPDQAGRDKTVLILTILGSTSIFLLICPVDDNTLSPLGPEGIVPRPVMAMLKIAILTDTIAKARGAEKMTLEKDSQDANDHNKAVQQIHEEYCQWIRATIQKLVRHGDDADDIFQDFFVLLLTKPQLAHSIKHKGFLYRTLNRDVIDFMRRKTAYKNRVSRFADKTPPATHDESTLDRILSQQECQFITQLIEQKLPDALRKVLKLHLDCNCSNSEIARRLNIGPASARRYLYLGRKKVKTLLTENGYHFKSAD